MSEGKKYDGGKPRWSLVPEGVMEDTIKVLEFGAQKYAPDNWKHVPEATTRYYDAAMRHMDAWWQGETKDGETGQSHLAHAMCCLMFLQWLENNPEKNPPNLQKQLQEKLEAFRTAVRPVSPPGSWVEIGKEFP